MNVTHVLLLFIITCVFTVNDSCLTYKRNFERPVFKKPLEYVRTYPRSHTEVGEDQFGIPRITTYYIAHKEKTNPDADYSVSMTAKKSQLAQLKKILEWVVNETQKVRTF